MQHLLFKRCVIMLSMLLLVLLAAQPDPYTSKASADSPAVLQLISEQDNVGVGGTVTMHILYHNTDVILESQASLEVQIPEGLTVADEGGAAWIEDKRRLIWTVPARSANRVTALRFQLLTPASAEIGTTYSLAAELSGSVIWEHTTPSVTVTVGPEIHQPFMQGYPSGNFRPKSELTRAETAAMIARIKGLRDVQGYATYDDLNRSHWAYLYIQQVTEEGYMVGYGRNFRPNDPITKAEMVTIMLRLQKIVAVPYESTYSDLLNHWSKNALGTAEAIRQIPPGDAAAFAPDLPIERQQAAQWMSQGLLRGPLGDGDISVEQHYPDVPSSHPYFGWIEEVSAVAHESEDPGIGPERLIRYMPESTNPF